MIKSKFALLVPKPRRSTFFAIVIIGAILGLGLMSSIAKAQTITLTPDPLNLLINESGDMTVTLDASAPAGGIIVALTLGGSLVATIPSEVTISEGATTGIFTVTAGGIAGTTDVFASTTGFVGDSATIVISEDILVNDCKAEASSATKAARAYAKIAQKVGRLCNNPGLTCDTAISQATSVLDQLNSLHINLTIACGP